MRKSPSVCVSGERSRGTRGQVVCQVPSSATHVSYMSFSPDDELLAISADKLVYVVDVKVCVADFSSFDLCCFVTEEMLKMGCNK